MKYLLLLLCACGPITYSLEDRVLLQPDDCIAADAGLDTLRTAMDVWNAQGAHFVLDNAQGFTVYDKVLPVQCVANTDLNPGDTDIIGQYNGNPVSGNRVIIDQDFWVTLGTDIGLPKGDTATGEVATYAGLMAHELGHALGMRHILDVGTSEAIMYWCIQYVPTAVPVPTPEDLLDLKCAQTGDDCPEVPFDPKH
jgi:hypothetical protein